MIYFNVSSNITIDFDFAVQYHSNITQHSTSFHQILFKLGSGTNYKVCCNRTLQYAHTIACNTKTYL